MAPRTTILLLLSTTLAAGAVLAFGSSKTPTFQNQLWISHFPQDDRDMVTYLVAFQGDGDEAKGVLMGASEWRQMSDTFLWKEAPLTFTFPQDDISIRFDSAKATRCDEGGFDFCLDLLPKGRREPIRFYSLEEWSFDGSSHIDTISSTVPCTHGGHESPDFFRVL